jgi:hypothetical protein
MKGRGNKKQRRMYMNTFYNGKKISKKNFLAIIQECIEEGWEDSTLDSSTERALEKIYYGEYEGREADIFYILDELQRKTKWDYLYPNANLQDIEIIITESGVNWYFQD